MRKVDLFTSGKMTELVNTLKYHEDLAAEFAAECANDGEATLTAAHVGKLTDLSPRWRRGHSCSARMWGRPSVSRWHSESWQVPDGPA